MDKVREALDREIISQIESLSQMTDGCEAKASAIDDLSTLYKLRLDELKLENELAKEKLGNDQVFKKQEAELQQKKKENILNLAIRVGEIVIPLSTYVLLFCKGLRFEETGTYTSTMLRNLLHNIKPER